MSGTSSSISTPHFSVSGRIERPVAEVFAAVADPDQLTRYFTTGGAKGRLTTGSTVTWDFADFPGAFPVEVIEVVEHERIVLQWDATEALNGTVRAGRAMPRQGMDVSSSRACPQLERRVQTLPCP